MTIQIYAGLLLFSVYQFLKIILFICCLAVLGLGCCAGFSLVAVLQGLLVAVASLAVEHEL